MIPDDFINKLIAAPPILYKYRNWNNEYHKDLLLKREIYFVSAKTFNDPFDLNIKLNYVGLSKDQINEYLFNLLKSGAKNLSDEQIRIIIKTQYNDVSKEFLEHLSNMQMSSLREYAGVFCLSKKWNSIPMWGYYADSHKGYCIGFKAPNLFFRKCGMLTKVHYEKEYPDIIPSGNFNTIDEMVQQMSYKSKSWKHEKEYRFVKPDYVGKTINYGVEDIGEIILGVVMPDHHKTEIMNHCKREFPEVKIFQSSLHANKFELIKTRVG